MYNFHFHFNILLSIKYGKVAHSMDLLYVDRILEHYLLDNFGLQQCIDHLVKDTLPVKV